MSLTRGTVYDENEFRHRIENTLLKYPYIVAENENSIIGYAYVSPFKTRAAYDWSVETSIYVDKDCRSVGIGRILYNELEKILKKQNILNMNACIAYTSISDSHLDNGSMKFHEKMGFTLAGRFTKCGYKFNTWYDMIWMEKIIGKHKCNPSEVIPFNQIEYDGYEWG